MTSQVALTMPDVVLDRVAEAVRLGLDAYPKTLPAWLFYDEAGSDLFEQITELPEYYLTRTEQSILTHHAGDMLTRAADGQALRIVELGAGSAYKTCTVLRAALERQGEVVYEPLDVSATALEAAGERVGSELPTVEVLPRVMDYTHEFELDPVADGERRLVLYIGSSIGNFEPAEAVGLLRRIRARLDRGDCILLGVDLVKPPSTLIDAYNDAAGVTAAFNLNILARLNRELGADFHLSRFEHRAVWNPLHSRIEMHLESLAPQRVHLPALDLTLDFAEGETIHTENSYKFSPGAAEAMLSNGHFAPQAVWTDPRGWFAVCLGQVE
jgi:L-histidine Nalpha-methyltransferase